MWLELRTEKCLEPAGENTVVMNIATVRKLSLLRRDLLGDMLAKLILENLQTGVDTDDDQTNATRVLDHVQS